MPEDQLRPHGNRHDTQAVGGVDVRALFGQKPVVRPGDEREGARYRERERRREQFAQEPVAGREGAQQRALPAVCGGVDGPTVQPAQLEEFDAGGVERRGEAVQDRADAGQHQSTERYEGFGVHSLLVSRGRKKR